MAKDDAEVHKGRGGARAGAKRAKSGPKLQTGTGKAYKRMLCLDSETIDALLEVGGGNASEGCRRLAHEWLKKQERRRNENSNT